MLDRKADEIEVEALINCYKEKDVGNAGETSRRLSEQRWWWLPKYGTRYWQIYAQVSCSVI